MRWRNAYDYVRKSNSSVLFMPEETINNYKTEAAGKISSNAQKPRGMVASFGAHARKEKQCWAAVCSCHFTPVEFYRALMGGGGEGQFDQFLPFYLLNFKSQVKDCCQQSWKFFLLCNGSQQCLNVCFNSSTGTSWGSLLWKGTLQLYYVRHCSSCIMRMSR